MVAARALRFEECPLEVAARRAWLVFAPQDAGTWEALADALLAQALEAPWYSRPEQISEAMLREGGARARRQACGGQNAP